MVSGVSLWPVLVANLVDSLLPEGIDTPLIGLIKMSDYLLEIGLEEMPASVILPAERQLRERVEQDLMTAQLSWDGMESFSTPRRLAILIKNLPLTQSDQTLSIKGPSASMAKDALGEWSRASIGFAKKNGVEVHDLILEEIQGSWFVVVRQFVKGRKVQEILGEMATRWITTLSFPKNMRWGAYQMRYVRPIRWVVSLWDSTLLPISLEMVSAQHMSHGHRFLHPEPVLFQTARDYLDQLRQAQVLSRFPERRQVIVEQIRQLETLHSIKIPLEEHLLEEVTNLVEWPTAFLGRFEPEFLEIPSAVLVTSMATHQRYFPVYDQNHLLLPYFVGVRNGNEYALETVINGNEKVLRARLSDARFFYQEDQKHLISVFLERLQTVVFFQGRGSVFQRVERIVLLSDWISKTLEYSPLVQSQAHRIAELCKFDLTTQMVYEFPALQGTMGRSYAVLQGESETIGLGIEEHYLPKSTQGVLPQQLSSIPCALADKLDGILVAFSLGKIPTGSADPYALRRMAQGILQIIFYGSIPLSLNDFFQQAIFILDQQQSLGLNSETLSQQLKDFFLQRKRFLMLETSIRYDVVDAVLKSRTLLPVQQFQLAQQLASVLSNGSLKLASEAVIRAMNLGEKITEEGTLSLASGAFQQPEEHQLWNAVVALKNSPLNVDLFFENLIGLEPYITAFFDKVLVMDPDPQVRANRLQICQSIAQWSQQYLDLRELVFGTPS